MLPVPAMPTLGIGNNPANRHAKTSALPRYLRSLRAAGGTTDEAAPDIHHFDGPRRGRPYISGKFYFRLLTSNPHFGIIMYSDKRF